MFVKHLNGLKGNAITAIQLFFFFLNLGYIEICGGIVVRYDIDS